MPTLAAAAWDTGLPENVNWGMRIMDLLRTNARQAGFTVTVPAGV
jgi:hypothetical protein